MLLSDHIVLRWSHVLCWEFIHSAELLNRNVKQRGGYKRCALL